MTRHTSSNYILPFEIGGHGLEWHVTYTPGAPETQHQSEEDPELEITRVDLQLTFRSLVGLTMHKIDISDLILELSGGEYPEHATEALYEAALEATVEGAGDDE